MFLLHLIVLLISDVSATTPEVNYKWYWETELKSREFEKNMYPQGTVDAWWASPGHKRKNDFLLEGVPREFRHMHAMVVALFYAQRADQREVALDWLESYTCENIVACEDTKLFFEGAYKSAGLTIKKSVLKKRIQKVFDSISARAKSLESTKPAPSLCGKDSPRAQWLEMEYALICPIGKAPPERGFCLDCEDTQRMQFRIGMDSRQMVMSSSYLDSFVHEGSQDCSLPWQAVLTCGGGGGSKSTYVFKCDRVRTSYPQQIRCTPISK